MICLLQNFVHLAAQGFDSGRCISGYLACGVLNCCCLCMRVSPDPAQETIRTFDAGARYRLPVADNDVTLRANVSNLANKAYWLNSSYLGDPRTLTFSAQLEF